MTSPRKLLSPQELIEWATLDALGLLDDYEADQYNKSFHAAPPSVQEEIVRVQSEVASDRRLLSHWEPPADLRHRVIDAVGEACREADEQLQPLAQIGARYGASAPSSPRRSDVGGQLWRVAALVLLGVSVVLGIFSLSTSHRSRQIEDAALGIETAQSLRALVGPGIADFVGNPNCRHAYLLSEDASISGMASVHVNEETSEVFVLTFDMKPMESPVTVVAVSADGTQTTIGSIVINVSMDAARFSSIPPEAMTATSFLMLDRDGHVLMTSLRS